MTESIQEGRHTPRPLFVQPDRLLGKVYFYTSSTDKYLQARLVFDNHGLTVDYFKTKTDPYDEDYRGDTTDLLTKAIMQVTDRVGAGRLVFVEDTSVRLEALSDPDRDVPGMEVKHWFQTTSFEDCDAALKATGGNRRAVVKSDIALKIPGLERPVFFHGETKGQVAERSPDFPPNPQHPWLTPDSFNGWFVPNGCTKPLGALSIEEALRYDFRVRAFEQLIDRLEEYAAALNLPSTAYRRKKSVPASTDVAAPLFGGVDIDAPALLVVGRTCAGKTTFAEFAAQYHEFRHIEASDIVRSLVVERDPDDDADGFAFAMRALDRLGHDVVARKILEQEGERLEGPFVVSGLRDLEEIRYMLDAVPRARVVLVEASERTRFERDVRQDRRRQPVTLEAFRLRDSRQDEFGLLPVVEDLAHVRVLNEGKIEDYHRQINAVVGDRRDEPGVDLAAHPRHGPDQHQLYRCLKILQEAASALQCDEIEVRSAKFGGTPIRHNNANKVLKAVPVLALRLDPPSDPSAENSARVRYAITQAGATYLDLLERRGPAFAAQSDHAR